MKTSRFLSLFLLCSLACNSSAMDSEQDSSTNTPNIQTPSKNDYEAENLNLFFRGNSINIYAMKNSETQNLDKSEDKKEVKKAPSFLSSFIIFASNEIGSTLAQITDEFKNSLIRSGATYSQQLITEKAMNLSINATPHIVNLVKTAYRKSYNFSERHPILSTFTIPTIATTLGAAIAYLGVKSKALPPWGNFLTIGASAYFGFLQMQAPWQFIRGKRFFLQQDHSASPSLSELFRSIPKIITKMMDALRDEDLYFGFRSETKGTISIYGENSSDEDKRNVIRAIARELNSPVFFITKKDFENSPENPLNTLLNITKKADLAAFSYNTNCSFVCFENFRELFDKYEEMRQLITSIGSYWNPIAPSDRIIFIGLDSQEMHDDHLRNLLFSFKIEISKSEADSESASSLKVNAQNIPTFKPIHSKEKKEEIACYETSDLTLEDISGRTPKEIQVIVHELQSDTPGQGADGILFWGKPGTGKTRLARALAGTFNVPFFNVKISRILQEGANAGDFIMTLFNNAHQKAISDKSKYSIIFLDEADSLLLPLSTIKDPTIRSANVALRAQLSGFSQDKKVICIAAVNSSPNKLDQALIRPGRLGTHIHFKLPDAEARKEVLIYYLSEKVTPETAAKIGEEYALKTDQFCQADLENLVKEAARWANAFKTTIENELPEILKNMQKNKERASKGRSENEAYEYSSSDSSDIASLPADESFSSDEEAESSIPLTHTEETQPETRKRRSSL